MNTTTTLHLLISAQYGDKLLTLSTCDNITDNGRWLVIGKRI